MWASVWSLCKREYTVFVCVCFHPCVCCVYESVDARESDGPQDVVNKS